MTHPPALCLQLGTQSPPIFTEERAKNNAKKPSARIVPLHLLLSKLYLKVIDQLPVGHNLTGCDTVAKVGTKKELLHNMLNSFDPFITGFSREALDDDMLQLVEHFQRTESKTVPPPVKQQQKIVDLPCSSMTVHNNIRRAVLQTKLCLDSPFLNTTDTMDFQDYGYVCHLNKNMILPKVSDDKVKQLEVKQPDVPHVLREHVQCTCKVAGLTCSVFGGCADHEDKGCQNSHTT